MRILSKYVLGKHNLHYVTKEEFIKTQKNKGYRQTKLLIGCKKGERLYRGSCICNRDLSSSALLNYNLKLKGG